MAASSDTRGSGPEASTSERGPNGRGVLVGLTAGGNKDTVDAVGVAMGVELVAAAWLEEVDGEVE